ncbi:Caffeoyl-CoA O-methyltransferase [Holothuria leucospilota]|uniref:Caffeoyl-CoA O-methyltransferase n=1 Tax=Holothuria leucospilota TaxID=206669 RepID=A0A9Q0YGN9_HOLLE|nr:Caffeoyl-CoA O-methyltransferase [Holothuria leucospilota]
MRSKYGMLSPPGQVRLLQFLVQQFNSKNILEVGTFTGYAAFGMAEVMAPGGKVTGIELETFFCDFVNDRAKKNNLNVEVKEGEAISVLQSLAREGNQFDFIYIDCVKEEYYDYYKIIMENNMLPPQGIIVCDNVLWRGTSVTRSNDTGRKVDDFNTAISQDKRVSSARSQGAKGAAPLTNSWLRPCLLPGFCCLCLKQFWSRPYPNLPSLLGIC